jgi:hypothetical protein
LGAIALLHALAAFWVAEAYGLEDAIRISLYGEGMLLMLVAAAVGLFTLWLLRIIVLKRPGRPIAYAIAEARGFQWP